MSSESNLDSGCNEKIMSIQVQLEMSLVTISQMIAQGMVVKHQKQNLYVVRLCYMIFLTSIACLQSRHMRNI